MKNSQINKTNNDLDTVIENQLFINSALSETNKSIGKLSIDLCNFKKNLTEKIDEKVKEILKAIKKD